VSTRRKVHFIGPRVGKNFKRLHGVILDTAHCWLMSIGDNVTMAPRVHVLAHDAASTYGTWVIPKLAASRLVIMYS
jgi:maltose O-acetyltransferase